jgi:thiamine pyrophosphate-dependent acetolactate synthase large subunit-like protein
LLAIGCRFSQLTTGTWTMRLPPSLAQIDIDEGEIGRHYPVTCGVQADAAEALRQLLALLPEQPRPPWHNQTIPVTESCPLCGAQMKLRQTHGGYFLGCSTYPRCRGVSEPSPETLAKIAAYQRQPWRLPGIELLAAMRRVLPRDTIFAVDVTRLAYILMAEYPLTHPRTWLHPSGSVAMAYGIPAAIGAKAAFPERTVVAIVGDGCFMMSALELATAVQEKLPIVVILVNDKTLSLIKSTQHRKYEERYIGVDLVHPDFRKLAEAFGVGYALVDEDVEFEKCLKAAIGCDQTTLIEVRPGDAPR